MSHAWGEVIHGGEVVGHYEYDGTSDFAHRRIFDTRQEMLTHWRTGFSNDAACNCGNPPTDVVLYSDYGGGFHWPARACLKCHAIVEGREPWPDEDFDTEPQDGHPLGAAYYEAHHSPS